MWARRVVYCKATCSLTCVVRSLWLWYTLLVCVINIYRSPSRDFSTPCSLQLIETLGKVLDYRQMVIITVICTDCLECDVDAIALTYAVGDVPSRLMIQRGERCFTSRSIYFMLQCWETCRCPLVMVVTGMWASVMVTNRVRLVDRHDISSIDHGV
jgi:hypothetical protein